MQTFALTLFNRFLTGHSLQKHRNMNIWWSTTTPKPLNTVSANIWWFLVVVETLHLHIIAVQA